MHRTTVSLAEPIPSEAPVGTPVALTVCVSCEQRCDLRGVRVEIVSDGRALATGHLSRCDNATWVTDEISLRLPEAVGQHVWTVVVADGPGPTDSTHQHSLAVRFTTLPHGCSLAVWDVPPGVSRGGPFEIKAGVRCAAGCSLAERRVEVVDEGGATVGEGTLGETPWRGTAALYWTSVALAAPSAEGVITRTVRVPPSAEGLAHEEAVATFSVRIDPPRDHRTTITVVDRNTQAPMAGVEVRCGSYSASTNGAGEAVIMLPAGTCDVSIRKDGLHVAPVKVHVPDTASVRLEAAPVATRAELNARAFKDYPWG